MRILIVLFALAVLSLPVWASERPNIVYVLADDFGYGDSGCYNTRCQIPTPNIDRLAREGIRFTDAHSGSAVCSPTLYGILTGRYAWRTRLRRGVLGPYDPPLISADRLTVPAFLKKQGYQTACVGKWHLGWDWPSQDGKVVFDRLIAGGPTARGFDCYFGTDVPNYPPYCFIENERTVGQPTAEKTTRDLNGRPWPMLPGWKFDAILPALSQKAVAFIADQARARKPFFLYFPLTSPHEPIAPSARFKGKSGISDLADFMMETDWALGEVLSALKKHGVENDTLIFFTADNGHAPYTGLPALRKAGHSVSGPLRGFKADLWEGGHRVPFLVRWPGKVKAGSICSEPICHTNLLATCAEVLGASPPSAAGEDSFSILPLLQGGQPERPTHEAVVHQAANGELAIRQGNWKLLFLAEQKAKDGKVALYELATDLGETKDVHADQADVVKRLTSLMEKYIVEGRSTPGPRQQNDVTVRLHQPSLKK